MALLGKAAMILSFDIVPEARNEHDDWHSHEHLPERLAIPGFLRGSRWTAVAGMPSYFVMYEVRELDVLASPAYLERLNNPSPWTSKMMAHYRGMQRGLCRLVGSFGYGLGSFVLVLRFSAAPEKETALRDWLLDETLPGLPTQSGLASAHLFESGLQAELTAEQRIRGQDAGVDSVLLVTGYSAQNVAEIAENTLAAAALERLGACAVTSSLYQLGHSLTDREVVAVD